MNNLQFKLYINIKIQITYNCRNILIEWHVSCMAYNVFSGLSCLLHIYTPCKKISKKSYQYTIKYLFLTCIIRKKIVQILYLQQFCNICGRIRYAYYKVKEEESRYNYGRQFIHRYSLVTQKKTNESVGRQSRRHQSAIHAALSVGCLHQSNYLLSSFNVTHICVRE